MATAGDCMGLLGRVPGEYTKLTKEAMPSVVFVGALGETGWPRINADPPDETTSKNEANRWLT